MLVVGTPTPEIFKGQLYLKMDEIVNFLLCISYHNNNFLGIGGCYNLCRVNSTTRGADRREV